MFGDPYNYSKNDLITLINNVSEDKLIRKKQLRKISHEFLLLCKYVKTLKNGPLDDDELVRRDVHPDNDELLKREQELKSLEGTINLLKSGKNVKIFDISEW